MNPKLPMVLRPLTNHDWRRTASPGEAPSSIDAADASAATRRRIVARAGRMALLSFLLGWPCFVAVAQMGVQDIFGRSLNQRGVTLVDWDGYLANPLAAGNLGGETNNFFSIAHH